MLWKLCWRNIQRRPWQTGLTLLVVAACTAAITACLLLANGIEKGARGAVDSLGADILVLPAGVEHDPGQVLFTGSPANVYMDASVFHKINAIRGVKEATAQFFSQTLNQSCCSLPEEYRLVGFDPDTDFLVRKLLANSVGRALHPDEVIVGGGVPAFLGDRVLILGNAYNVAGYLRPMGGSVDKTIFIDIDTARRIAGESPYLQHLWRDNGDPDNLISAVLVRTEAGSDPEPVARSINRLGEVRAVAAEKVYLDLKGQLLVIIGIIWVMVLALGLVIMASLLSRYMSLVIERQEELGLLRALGTRKGQVFWLVMAETILSALMAAVVGSGFGLAMATMLQKVVHKSSSFPFLLPPAGQLAAIFGAILLAVVGISTLAAAWPARTCAALDPVTALTEGELK